MSDRPTFDWDSGAGFGQDEEGPERPSNCGPFADNFDHHEKLRRIQMNVNISEEVK